MEKGTKRTKSNMEGLEPKMINSESERKMRENLMSLEVKKINNHGEVDIGGDPTFLALKNESTYMMATDRRGMKLILDTEEIYSEKLPNHSYDNLKGIVYADHLDCFFFAVNGKIYRKDVDDQPFFIFMDSIGSKYEHYRLRYSTINKKMLMLASGKLSVIDLDEKRFEFRFVNSLEAKTENFVLFGEQEDKVISASEEGDLFFHVIDYKRKKLLFSNHYKIEMIDDIDEDSVDEDGNEIWRGRDYTITSSLAVSDSNDHIIIEVGKDDDHTYFCSRTIVFKVEGSILVKKAVLVINDVMIYPKLAMACCGCFGSHILWVGVGTDEHNGAGDVQIYDYNTDSEKLRELKEKSVEHHEDWPKEIHRMDDRFYYTGRRGRVMALTVSY